MSDTARHGTDDRVAVVIPAYNAAATIDGTLRSVRAQSHAALDIVVVDDGSTDATRGIAQQHAQRDPRVRVVTQPNGGVARARNRGIAETDAPWIAPVDADDLWHPKKIRLQLDAIRRAGPRAGLVYTWSATLDREDRIVGLHQRATASGSVIGPLLQTNLLENASCALFRRAAFDQAGGFDPSLRDAGAQGCEDWLFYLAVARDWDFAVVPAFLTGYRVLPGNMSSNHLAMWRSQRHVSAWALQTWPDRRAEIRAGDVNTSAWLFGRAALAGHAQAAGFLFRQLLQEDPSRAWLALAQLPREGVRTYLNPALRRRGWFMPNQAPDNGPLPHFGWGTTFPIGEINEPPSRAVSNAAGLSSSQPAGKSSQPPPPHPEERRT